ncbi:hypothetical protein LDENG_00091250 [Lucifuga dentata]|nr:hypothetical protein LDENG_00091250 [Lucifuga dentata]
MGTSGLHITLRLSCLALLVGSTLSIVNIISTESPLSLSSANASHIGHVCATWGNFHWKTFDGDFFQLPSTCNHVVVSQCKASYENFNIQMKRTMVGDAPTISNIIMKLEGTVVELSQDKVVVNSQVVSLPYVAFGVTVKGTLSRITVVSKLGLKLLWNMDDSLNIEIDTKFQGQTCGLCGNFDGTSNELVQNGAALSLSDYAEAFKVNGPTENCEEPQQIPVQSCGNEAFCDETFLSAPFIDCYDRLDVGSFSKACMADMCSSESADSFLCKTISEFSRECVHAGGRPQQWRNSSFCGTVFDDVGNSGCVAVKDCPCMHNNKVYNSGESYSSKCRSCVCDSGRWTCTEDNCPGTCSVEGGAHVNTFDEKVFTFHGDCSYVMAQDCGGSSYTVLVDLVKCGLSDSKTCLRAVTMSLYSNAVIVKILTSGQVYVNNILSQLPLFTPELSAFKPSSFYIVIDTKVGIQAMVQLSPTMQVFITAHNELKGTTCGLCGNFNDKVTDDFKVASELVESTAVAFANSWKTRVTCPDVKTHFENPCSQGINKEQYAQFWCSKLTDPSGMFAPCHSVISPSEYKDNCMYDSCNCEMSEDCMCAAISSYVYACSAVGIQLSGWRDVICSKYTTLCPAETTYGYGMTSCGRTCHSLSQPDYSCQSTFTTVDGCGCAEGTYMNDEGQCVLSERCPCYDMDTVIPSGQVITKEAATW